MRFVDDRLPRRWLESSYRGALIALTVLATACGDSSPSRNPVGPDAGTDASALAGDWSGTIVIISGATGKLRLRLAGPDAAGGYAGTWSAVFADTSLNRQGTLSVTVRSLLFPGTPPLPMLTVDLTPVPPPTCDSFFGEGVYMLTLGVIQSNRLTGDGMYGGCDGRINIARVQLAR